MHPASLLADTSHRPWPMPARRWSVYMQWHDLLFLHWPVPAAALQSLLPAGVEVETFDGSAWLGVVPFVMRRTRLRPLPPLPTACNFPELNVRTYVRAGGRSGVWFFSLDAASRLAVLGARVGFRLPYFRAAMTCRRDGDEVRYRSERRHRGAPPATFAARWRPRSPFAATEPGSLASWLTDRYCLFAADRRGRIGRTDIHHRRWQLAPADVAIEHCAMTALLGFELSTPPVSVLAAAPLAVVAWPLERV
jgi:hypothetical protein